MRRARFPLGQVVFVVLFPGCLVGAFFGAMHLRDAYMTKIYRQDMARTTNLLSRLGEQLAVMRDRPRGLPTSQSDFQTRIPRSNQLDAWGNAIDYVVNGRQFILKTISPKFDSVLLHSDETNLSISVGRY